VRQLEEKRIGAGHWHIEGYCTVRMGRTWSTKFEGCQANGSDNPAEQAAWNTSLRMVRDYIRVKEDMT
jgi:hypothetical protein